MKIQIEKKADLSYILLRDITPKECHWLDRKYEKGELVYLYSGFTYKLIGTNGYAFTIEPGSLPFFELPKNAVSFVYADISS
jgi:hypothetical protein